MDFKKVVEVCTDFAIKNDVTITCCHNCWEVVLSVNQQNDASDRQICLKYCEYGFWRVNSMKNGVAEHFTIVNNQEQLLDTLNLELVATPMKVSEKLLNAKLADMHAILEKHTEMLQSLLEHFKVKVPGEQAQGESTNGIHEKGVLEEQDTSGAP